MKVLLVNPYDPGKASISPWPHLGLTLMAGKARVLGHQVFVVDYAFTPKAPRIEDLIKSQSPDVVGITLYTAHMGRARELIRELRWLTSAPVVVGGPHATLYAEELAAECLADVVFRGECDLVFARELPNIRIETASRIVAADPPDLAEIPVPDFNLAFGAAAMTYYPLQLSRGCPFGCSFCSVRTISTRRVRYRDSGRCLDEIEAARPRFPRLRFFRIVDDCPTFDLPRFKDFLQEYLRRGIGVPLHIDNLRADRFDDEMLDLIRRIGVDHLCIGVESGNPKVFAAIDKGEKLDDIVRAAKMIKSHGIRLYTCFIVGLPESTPLAERNSIRLARAMKPAWIYWNLFQPHKGTEARAWFERHGRIFGEEDKSSLIDLGLGNTDAPCDTEEFPAAERRRMQIAASLATGAYWLNPLYFPRYILIIRKNRLGREFLRGFSAVLRINLGMLGHRIARAFRGRYRRAGRRKGN
jgi:anaerobic magnesium-protoporphyrin IX monomethyl ester cyclase